jgi:hypothetical protein
MVGLVQAGWYDADASACKDGANSWRNKLANLHFKAYICLNQDFILCIGRADQNDFFFYSHLLINSNPASLILNN